MQTEDINGVGYIIRRPTCVAGCHVFSVLVFSSTLRQFDTILEVAECLLLLRRYWRCLVKMASANLPADTQHYLLQTCSVSIGMLESYKTNTTFAFASACVLIDTARVNETVECPSVSVPPIDRSSGVRRVCCWAPGRQGIGLSLDRCTSRPRWAALLSAVASVMLTADVGSRTQTCLSCLFKQLIFN